MLNQTDTVTQILPFESIKALLCYYSKCYLSTRPATNEKLLIMSLFQAEVVDLFSGMGNSNKFIPLQQIKPSTRHQVR